MNKKKHGLLAWTIVAVVLMLIALGGFMFTFVGDCVKLYANKTSESVIAAMTLMGFNTCIWPVYHGFTSVIMDFTSPFGITLIAYLAVILVILIAFIVVAAVKKNSKYLWHIIPLLVFATIGLYFYLAFTVSAQETYSADTNPLLLAMKGEGPLHIAIFGKYNYIQKYLAWATLAVIGLFGIAFIGYIVMLFIRAAEKHEEVVAVEEKVEEALVTTPDTTKTTAISEPAVLAPVPVEEPEVVPVEETPVEEKPKKKVFLVVKRYNASTEKVEAVEEERKTENLTAEDIREIIRSEHEAYESRKIQEAANRVMERPTTTASTCSAEPHETRTVAPTPVKAEVKTPTTPIIIAIPDPVTEEDEAAHTKCEEPKPAPVKREEIRDIVREELRRAIEEIVKVPQETVVTETVEEIEEVPAPVAATPAKNETIAVLDEKNVPVEVQEAKEEPVVEPAPVVEPKAPAEPIERISFADRIRKADDEMKENYNTIKSLLMSYGLKNRTSNGGDAFRLHKVTYAKIAVAGKSLKIYLNLDPNDYKNTTLPIKDASSKAIYKEIPLVFKIKSGLSMRRCEQLIGEMMDKHGIEQVDRVEHKDYVALLDENTDDEE